MKITCNHSASSYGVPVILDDAGNPMDYVTGLRAVRETLGITFAQLAELCGVSPRTAENWGQGRPIPASALNVMAGLLETCKSHAK